MESTKHNYDSLYEIESKEYLTEQIVTYIGNKRKLLVEINDSILEIKKKIKKDKLITLDLFSGSGVVARLLKQHSSLVIANDLEKYSKLFNDCFLSNKNDFDINLYNKYLNDINNKIERCPIEGIITKNYAPKDENNITKDDRVFYTRKNAIYIDSFRKYVEVFEQPYKNMLLCQLLIEASIHTNTSGVFKGFYKNKNTGVGMYGGIGENALERIKGNITIKEPVFSNFITDYKVYQEDAEQLVKKLNNIDIAYLDPPYNQHPYGSNYFMLNLILENKEKGNISKVSGIPNDWNRSLFNKKQTALSSFENIIRDLDSKYIIISYNNEGFITYDEMINMLSKYGKIKTKAIKYNTFRGSRNLKERNIYTNEYIFILEKRL